VATPEERNMTMKEWQELMATALLIKDEKERNERLIELYDRLMQTITDTNLRLLTLVN
jgi:hypothetical protein